LILRLLFILYLLGDVAFFFLANHVVVFDVYGI